MEGTLAKSGKTTEPGITGRHFHRFIHLEVRSSATRGAILGYLYLTQLSGRLLSDTELQVFLNHGDLINGLRISNKRNGDVRVETVIEFLTLPPVLIVYIMPMQFDLELRRMVVVGWSIRSPFTSILKLPGPRPL